MAVLNPNIQNLSEQIAQAGYIALFAPDTKNPDGSYTATQSWIDFGEVKAAGATSLVYNPNEQKITGRRLGGNYTAKTLSTELELGYDFSTVHAWDPLLLALNSGSTEARASGTAGVRAISAVPRNIRGQFLFLEAGDPETGIVLVTYHPVSDLKGNGSGEQGDVKTLAYQERAQPRGNRALPAGYAALNAEDTTHGAVYLAEREALDELLAVLGVTNLADVQPEEDGE